MDLEIKAEMMQGLLAKLSGDSNIHAAIEDSNRYRGTRDSYNIQTEVLSDQEVDDLILVAKEHDDRSLLTVLNAIARVRNDPSQTKIKSLKSLVDGIAAYMRIGFIDGWLYKKMPDETFVPYLVENIAHYPKTQHNKEHVDISLVVNGKSRSEGKSGLQCISVYFFFDNTRDKTIEECLIEMDLYHETPELKALYEEHLAMFESYRSKFGEQFICFGIGGIMEQHSSGMGRYYRPEKIDATEFNFKCVNDEELNENRTFVSKISPQFWHKVNDNRFCRVPYECVLYMFHLELHRQVWMHVSYLRPYVYDQNLHQKLVLPETHRDLIEVLVTDMDVLMDDIIAGKSGGTTILCQGSSGLGKTLTAEVYCEMMCKPLYKVNAGRLGVSIEDVENNLADILKRSQRWKAILLLDEADVYIRRRDTDIHQNAIVASFLRTIEYFNGLFFMTTNRGDQVDDAILSRCIARITYDLPGEVYLPLIWEILAKQFQIKLSDDLINELVKTWPMMAGRDVKEMLKLVSKYVRRRNLPYSMDVFTRMAQFRGLK